MVLFQEARGALCPTEQHGSYRKDKQERRGRSAASSVGCLQFSLQHQGETWLSTKLLMRTADAVDGSVPLPVASCHLPFASVTQNNLVSREQQTWLQDQLLRLPFMSHIREERERLRLEEEYRVNMELQRQAELERARSTEQQQQQQSGASQRRGQRRKQQRSNGSVEKVQDESFKTQGEGNQHGAEQGPSIIRLPPPPGLLPEDKQLWQAFSEMDINGDGQLDWVELRSALEKLGLPCTPEYLVTMMKEYDTDGNDKIDWEEFRFYVHKRETEIDKAFRAFDMDGNGEISRDELGKVLRNAGIPARDLDIERMVQRVDGNADAAVSYDEFRRFAAFLPSLSQLNSNPMLMAAFWSSNSHLGYKDRPRTAKNQTFVIFDLLVRTSLAISMGVVLIGVMDGFE